MDQNGTQSIIIHQVTPEELQRIIKDLIRTEFFQVNKEIQQVIGEDDLVSTGTACRILGVCSKVFRILVQQGHFTVFHHLKERRFIRGELLEYRNRFRLEKIT